jgi:hypothetical protein
MPVEIWVWGGVSSLPRGRRKQFDLILQNRSQIAVELTRAPGCLHVATPRAASLFGVGRPLMISRRADHRRPALVGSHFRDGEPRHMRVRRGDVEVRSAPLGDKLPQGWRVTWRRSSSRWSCGWSATRRRRRTAKLAGSSGP